MMDSDYTHHIRPRAISTPHHHDSLAQVRCAKVAELPSSPSPASRLRFPRHDDLTCPRDYTSARPVQWEHMNPHVLACVKEQEHYVHTRHENPTERWVNDQIHLASRPNQGRRWMKPTETEELRHKVRDEFLYEHEVEAHRWTKYEEEMRRRMREREEEKNRLIQTEIRRIQARVRQRRDSERHIIAEERRREAEKAKERVTRERARLERATIDAWNVYELRWVALSAAYDGIVLKFRDIPWPLLVPPLTPDEITPERIGAFILSSAHSPEQSPKERIRAALLRWHPDRFCRVLGRVRESERNAVEEGVGIVVRCLNDLLTKDNKASQVARRGSML
ncbi:uncharacterized protein EDB91DRAFT_584443 [Suillus paluster]|uniref:uncharacterized protein n=1 Tax=Suillus paluster TaxID=48578 RepID=UPI001B886268|nr:uncharacterized protein EDB91DRAFT_584443 [Suillus paluster]KAG1734721.1 hypothetical protein EDB91DRAFT_584443 [Suillus paluster]